MVARKSWLWAREYAELLGWVGEYVWHAHCCQPDPGEIALFARTRTGVAYCPSSNCQQRFRKPPARSPADHAAAAGALRRGRQVSLVSDTSSTLGRGVVRPRKEAWQGLENLVHLRTYGTDGRPLVTDGFLLAARHRTGWKREAGESPEIEVICSGTLACRKKPCFVPWPSSALDQRT